MAVVSMIIVMVFIETPFRVIAGLPAIRTTIALEKCIKKPFADANGLVLLFDRIYLFGKIVVCLLIKNSGDDCVIFVFFKSSIRTGNVLRTDATAAFSKCVFSDGYCVASFYFHITSSLFCRA